MEKKREISVHKDEILEQRAAQSHPRLQQQGGCDAEPRNRIFRENFGRVSPATRSRKDPKKEESSRRRCKGGTFSTSTTGTTARTTVFSCYPRKIFEANQPLEAGRGLQKHKKAAAKPLQSLAKKKRSGGKGIGAYERGGIYRTRWTRG
ncbi:hypothetical protein BHE74_00054393 [Ensete ventricosum]|nr:hypothetical protein GW17_00044488 [Ensete ventricosum]RWW40207.1 hypothetical protein BHE74_00054393 [Ensete ventricosum]